MEHPFIFKPRRCIMEVTADCNLKCVTCNNWTDAFREKRKGRFLSGDHMVHLQAQLFTAGVRHVTYLGGEPFLNGGLLRIASEAKRCGIATAVVTNGTAIDRPRIEEIVSRQLFDAMIFSIDGPEKIHDCIRGVPGVFSRACAAIRHIQRIRKSARLKKPRVYIYVTLCAMNRNCVEPMMLLARKLDAHAIRFMTASCIDGPLMDATNRVLECTAILSHSYGYPGNHGLMLSPSDKEMLREEIKTAATQAAAAGIRFHSERTLQTCGTVRGCFFLGDGFVITASGDVLLCPMLPQLSVGSLHSAALHAILAQQSVEDHLVVLQRFSAAQRLPICTQCCIDKLSPGKDSVYIGTKEMPDGEQALHSPDAPDKDIVL